MQNIKGVVRKVDDLGRVVIPSELRKFFEIDVGARVDIYPVKDKIVLKVVRLHKKIADS